jgi:universal stress protein A
MQTNFIRKIIIAVDFSRASNSAFAFAIQLAKNFNAETIAVFVKNADDLAIAMRQDIRVFKRELPQLKEKVNKFIDRKFQLLASRLKIEHRVRFVILEGNVCDEVLKLAKQEKADLIIAGSRGRSLISNLLVGSTARELVSNSSCPVVLVNEKQRRRT